MTGREKMPRYDRTCDRKELIRRSLDVFLRKTRDDSFGGWLRAIVG